MHYHTWVTTNTEHNNVVIPELIDGSQVYDMLTTILTFVDRADISKHWLGDFIEYGDKPPHPIQIKLLNCKIALTW